MILKMFYDNGVKNRKTFQKWWPFANCDWSLLQLPKLKSKNQVPTTERAKWFFFGAVRYNIKIKQLSYLLGTWIMKKIIKNICLKMYEKMFYMNYSTNNMAGRQMSVIVIRRIKQTGKQWWALCNEIFFLSRHTVYINNSKWILKGIHWKLSRTDVPTSKYIRTIL